MRETVTFKKYPLKSKSGVLDELNLGVFFLVEIPSRTKFLENRYEF